MGLWKALNELPSDIRHCLKIRKAKIRAETLARPLMILVTLSVILVIMLIVAVYFTLKKNND